MTSNANTECSGLAIYREGDDQKHPEQLYAASDHAWMYVGDTAATATMAASAAALDIGNDDCAGADWVLGGESGGADLDIATGEFTAAKSGDYEPYIKGRVTGEEDEDVTIALSKAPVTTGTFAAAGEAYKAIIELDASTGVAELSQQFEVSGRPISLDKGDKLKWTVLGSNNEVIQFQRCVVGFRLVKSQHYIPNT